MDALSFANGEETDYSKIQEVVVLRETEEGIKSFRLDMTQGKKFMLSEVFYLQPNDVVYVEPDKSKSLKINLPVFTLVMSSISTLVLLLELHRELGYSINWVLRFFSNIIIVKVRL